MGIFTGLTGSGVGDIVAYVQLTGDKEFIRKMGTVDAAVSKSSKIMQGALAAAAAAGVAAFALSIDAAAKWESSFTGVTKTTDGLRDDFGNLNDTGREMANQFRELALSVPVSVHDLARIGELGGQLGIAKEELVPFTRTIAELGATTNLSYEQAAMTLARFLNVTKDVAPEGMPVAEQIERLGSAAVDLGNNLAAQETEILEFAGRIAGAGTNVGLTQAEILSFSTALASIGVRAEAGATAFSRVILDMQTSIEKGGDKIETFAEVAGLSVGEFSQMFKRDAAGAVLEFINGLRTLESRGMTTSGVLEDLELSNVRVRDMLLLAKGGMDQFVEALGRGPKAFEQNKALAEEFEERLRTFKSQLQLTKNLANDLAIDFGETLLPQLRAVFTSFNDNAGAIKDFVTRWSNLNTLITGGGIATALKLLSDGIGFLNDNLGGNNDKTGKAADAMGRLRNELMPTQLQIKGVSDGFYDFTQEAKGATDETDNVATKTKVMGDFMAMADTKIGGAKDVTGEFSGAMIGMQTAAEGALPSVKELARGAMFDNLGDALTESVVPAFQSLVFNIGQMGGVSRETADTMNQGLYLGMQALQGIANPLAFGIDTAMFALKAFGLAGEDTIITVDMVKDSLGFLGDEIDRLSDLTSNLSQNFESDMLTALKGQQQALLTHITALRNANMGGILDEELAAAEARLQSVTTELDNLTSAFAMDEELTQFTDGLDYLIDKATDYKDQFGDIDYSGIVTLLQEQVKAGQELLGNYDPDSAAYEQLNAKLKETNNLIGLLSGETEVLNETMNRTEPETLGAKQGLGELNEETKKAIELSRDWSEADLLKSKAQGLWTASLEEQLLYLPDIRAGLEELGVEYPLLDRKIEAAYKEWNKQNEAIEDSTDALENNRDEIEKINKKFLQQKEQLQEQILMHLDLIDGVEKGSDEYKLYRAELENLQTQLYQVNSQLGDQADLQSRLSGAGIETTESVRSQIASLEDLLIEVDYGGYEYEQLAEKINTLKERLGETTEEIEEQKSAQELLSDAGITTKQSIIDQIEEYEKLLPLVQDNSWEQKQLKDKISALKEELILANLEIQDFSLNLDSMFLGVTTQYAQFEADVENISGVIDDLTYFNIDFDTTNVDEQVGYAIAQMQVYLNKLSPESDAYSDAQEALDALITKFEEIGGSVPTDMQPTVNSQPAKDSIDEIGDEHEVVKLNIETTDIIPEAQTYLAIGALQTIQSYWEAMDLDRSVGLDTQQAFININNLQISWSNLVFNKILGLDNRSAINEIDALWDYWFLLTFPTKTLTVNVQYNDPGYTTSSYSTAEMDTSVLNYQTATVSQPAPTENNITFNVDRAAPDTTITAETIDNEVQPRIRYNDISNTVNQNYYQ